MTATQAPTPGPLSRDDVNRECKACGAFQPDLNAACTFCGLAPTAPVEASGSEMTIADVCANIFDRDEGEPNYQVTDVQSRYIIVHQLRASADIQDTETKRKTGWATTSDRASLMRKAADTIERLALLSARPLALGGQQGEVECDACKRGEVRHFSTDDGFWVEITTSAGGANEHGLNGWIETLEHYPDGSTKRREYVAIDSPALSTTPARAEAQDEGAAGKREQAIKELIAGYAVMHEVICFMAGTSGAAGRWYYEKANAAFEKVKPLHVFGNDLATHPSPTPAADADRVRALETVAYLADELINRGGLINRGVDRGLVVVEKADRSDPHYRLCLALAALKSTAAKEGGE